MPFKSFTKEEYRALDWDGLQARKAEVLAEFDNPDADDAALEAESRACAAELDRRARAAELRAADARAVSGGAAAALESRSFAPAAQDAAPEDPLDTDQYRKAFMEWVCRRAPMPAEYRAATATSDVAPMVPTTMGREIVRKMEEYGSIWRLVRKMSVQGGLWFRVVDLNLQAHWIGETEVSEYQKVEADDKVSFSFFELECRMAQTLLASAVTFDDFQAMFVPAVAEAMVRALEQAIIRGDGTKGPLGITVDPRVTRTVEMAAADMADWKQWRRKVKAAMPKSYRRGYYIMAQSTWDGYVETLSDDNNAPVSIGYNPVTGEEEYRFMGSPVITVEDDVLPDYDAAANGDVFAIFGDLRNYAVNTQPRMPMSTVRWVDHETNQEKIKALMAVDGKVLDPHGFTLVKKSGAASA